MNTHPYFKHREQAELARQVGIKPQRLWEYLNGKAMSVRRAQLLEAASLLALGPGRKIPASAWLGLENHPAIKR